jgi:hypothetical protein
MAGAPGDAEVITDKRIDREAAKNVSLKSFG